MYGVECPHRNGAGALAHDLSRFLQDGPGDWAERQSAAIGPKRLEPPPCPLTGSRINVAGFAFAQQRRTAFWHGQFRSQYRCLPVEEIRIEVAVRFANYEFYKNGAVQIHA